LGGKADASMNDEAPSHLSIEAASVYEQLFVPALFGWWAQKVATIADLRPQERVLDVACGTGVLARAAAECVGPDGKVVGLDPDQGMLSVAARHAAKIEWRAAAAESLPFEDNTFDAVLSQFGLMFFRDPLRALCEVRRVLRPGGRAVFAVWAPLEETPAYVALIRLLDRLFGKAVADGLRAPFAMGSAERLCSLFSDAAFASPRLETRHGLASFPSLAAWVEADAKGWLELDDAQHQHLLAAAPEELRSFVTSDGSVAFSIAAHIVVAER
jgi:ubiquinone/menaquinone biosynthesis C-methylase UbiE